MIEARSECQNCGKIWTDDELNPIEDLSMRVSPGEPMPSGECPECGALCQEITTYERSAQLNLWELMILSSELDPGESKRKKTQALIQALEHHGQELSINAASNGWLLRVHSCYSDLAVDILIPHNPEIPVTVLRDNRGTVKVYRDED